MAFAFTERIQLYSFVVSPLKDACQKRDYSICVTFVLFMFLRNEKIKEAVDFLFPLTHSSPCHSDWFKTDLRITWVPIDTFRYIILTGKYIRSWKLRNKKIQLMRICKYKYKFSRYYRQNNSNVWSEFCQRRYLVLSGLNRVEFCGEYQEKRIV